MAKRYGTFTPARRAALHRAALISAAKRRRGYGRATNVARARRNLSIQRAHGNLRKQSAAHKAFQNDVNQARVQYLGRKSRSQKNQDTRRVLRAVGRHATIATSTALLIGVNYPDSKVGRKINKGFDRASNETMYAARTARNYGRAAKASPHYAKGFAKGAHAGFANHRAANRNLRHVDFGRATATRMGPLALTAGSGSSTKTRMHGRRVRGY